MADGASKRLTFTLFSALWALATLFHIWVDRRAAGVASDPSGVAVVQAAAGVLALALLAWPRSSRLLVALAVAGPVLAWFEAPFMGNHWMLVALIDIGIVLGALATRFNRDRLADVVMPIGRWSLIAFYAFASFSKLNFAFLDPEVSCGTFFFDELAGGFGIGTPLTVTDAGWARLVPLGIVAVELAVPTLLLFRRTRHLGVLVGLLFHALIAFDSTHPFHDFSSALLPLFLLFLPDGFAGWLRDRVPKPRRDVLHAAAVLACCAVTAAVIADAGDGIERFVVLDGRSLAWAALSVGSIVSVLAYLRSVRPEPIRLVPAMRIAPAWLAVIPALVIGNGLTPYLEIKTTYGWNMYANLVTVDGETNHLFVRRTIPVTDYQDDLVRILATTDPGLFAYVDSDYRVPFLQLRIYLSENPDAAIHYERNGVVHQLAKASDYPALVEPVPGWQQRLFNFRAVDDQDPARCQPGWMPAH